MKYRKLGKTGIMVGEIGLGTEYLVGQPRETACSVIHEAVEKGVNYFDILFAFPEYRVNMGHALKHLREKAVITGHIGSGEINGQFRKTRDFEENEKLFEDLLVKLNTDYVDVVLVQFVDEEDDYRQIIAPGGLLELAKRIKQESKARFIGMSTHSYSMAIRIADNPDFDVLMYPRNIVLASVPQKELYEAVKTSGTGLVAMKPFGGGRVLHPNRPVQITPVQCLSYILSNEDVSCVIPGVKNLEELNQSLKFEYASDEEKEFVSLIPAFYQDSRGKCNYCNHCLPCPVNLNVAQVMMLLDMCYMGDADSSMRAYGELPVKASDCIECRDCTSRCPFEVDVVAKMHEAVNMFGE